MKLRIVGDRVEVGVQPRLEAVLAVQPDRLGEVLDAALGVAGHAGQQCKTVKGVVGGLLFQQDLGQVFARIVVVPVVQQRDGVVVALFVALELGRSLVDLRDARRDVHADAVGQILRARLPASR